MRFLSFLQAASIVLLLSTASVVHAQAIDVGTCAFPLAEPLRSIHVGGNWGTNWWVVKWWEEKDPPRGALIPPDYIEYVKNLHVNWVGISVALHIEDSTDSTVERSYSQDIETRTFSDEALRQMIREFREHDFNVYLTLAFEIQEAEQHSERPLQRYQLGDPGHPDTGVPPDHQHCPECAPPIEPEFWPWSPSHPDHNLFVDEFWSTYTEQAVHFARIAQEEGVRMYSLGTETDRLFRTRSGGDYFRNDFYRELESLVDSVRSQYHGLLTYDMDHSAITDADEFFKPGSEFLWEDLGLDVVGISAWFPLADSPPTTVMSVESLRQVYEQIFEKYLVPLQSRNVGRPIVFLEYGARDTVASPAEPADYEALEYVFSDMNGNGLDDGEETQVNIFKALFATMDEYPGVLHGAFFWDNWIISHQEWQENWVGWRRHNFRGKLAEDVVRELFACWKNTGARRGRPVSLSDLTGLRASVDAARSRCGLPAYTWTDAIIEAGVTAIRALHMMELRSALTTAYEACDVTPAPTYTDHPIERGVTPVRAVHFTELHAMASEIR